MTKVSIIIPCYNVEQYLRQCLDSVVNQTLQDIEIICINDGSTDSTLQILEEYAENDNRMKIISKPNSGYGASMNVGLAHATGEYIGIVESDDFASINMFEDLYNIAKQYNADVVKSNWYEYIGSTNNITITPRFNSLPKFVPLSPLEFKDLYIIPSLIASCLYSKEYLHNNEIFFLTTPGASYQDTGFAAKTIMTANRIVLTDNCYYYYRTDNLASSVKQTGKIFYICEEYSSINDYMDRYLEVKKALEQQKCANQFREYLWNLNRLDNTVDKEFLKRFSKEFESYYKDGILKSEFYERYSENLVKLLIEKPDKFYKKVKKVNSNKIISIRSEGKHQVFKIFGRSILKLNKQKVFHWYYKQKEKKELKYILKQNINIPIFVMSPFIPYNSPMKQRFQHLAEQLSNKGYLVFYCTNSPQDINGWKYFKKLSDKLYLTSCFDTISEELQKAYFYYTPISHGYNLEHIKQAKKHNWIIYDHIDSFSVGANKDNSLKLWKRHKMIAPLCNLGIYSSKKLKNDYDNLLAQEKLIFVPNGVDYEHFARNTKNHVPIELKDIVSQQKLIIGCHGALTVTWIDFDLIDKTAKMYTDCNIVLIGSTYLEEDKQRLQILLDKNKNIYYIPAVEYNKLPQYTNYFDISIIPFKHGEIALNTNPIKLFENMAMGIPTVVTRDLVECKGYEGVWVAENDEIFLKDIEKAIKTKDDNSLTIKLQNYAKAQTWEKQAEKIINMIRNYK